jgi:hypothetical protein
VLTPRDAGVDGSLDEHLDLFADDLGPGEPDADEPDVTPPHDAVRADDEGGAPEAQPGCADPVRAHDVPPISERSGKVSEAPRANPSCESRPCGLMPHNHGADVAEVVGSAASGPCAP